MIKKGYILILLIFISFQADASKLDTLSVLSESMGISINNIIIKPDSYQELDKMPVVYLLHGAYGDYTDWTSKVKGLGDFCDNNDIMIVCPDGGYNSWYFDSPIDSDFQYESYIVRELIPYVDSLYSTSKEREKRAITGLSMGGHGAFYLAFRNPNLFGSAGSMSGGLDIRPFHREWNISDRIGAIKKNPENWENNTVINLIENLNRVDINLIFDCGKDDFFFDVNNAFHNKLLNYNIAHIYNIKEGGHNWQYWNKSVFEHLDFFNEYFISRQ